MMLLRRRLWYIPTIVIIRNTVLLLLYVVGDVTEAFVFRCGDNNYHPRPSSQQQQSSFLLFSSTFGGHGPLQITIVPTQPLSGTRNSKTITTATTITTRIRRRIFLFEPWYMVLDSNTPDDDDDYNNNNNNDSSSSMKSYDKNNNDNSNIILEDISAHSQEQPVISNNVLSNHIENRKNRSEVQQLLLSTFTSNPTRSILFSMCMVLSGAILGPFLDSYHSLYHVLQYDQPWTCSFFFFSSTPTSATTNAPLLELVTTNWVPPLFGIAGFLIGWMYILLDVYYYNDNYDQNNDVAVSTHPSPPKILFGIAFFTFQYWWSGVLYQSGVDRTTIFWIMSLSASFGFWTLDRTLSGGITSLATALGGPLIEVGLISLSRHDALFHGMGYHYTDLGETGYFPLWILPIYFLGGPANGNLARGYWTFLSSNVTSNSDAVLSPTAPKSSSCANCNDTRCAMCPNWYVSIDC